MVGITSINGFPISMDARFSKIKSSGFDSILLWWGNDETESRAERSASAKKHCLNIENAHSSTDNLNFLWTEGVEGEFVLSELKQEIIDCADFGISTLVVHLTNGSCPPPVSDIGISRIYSLIKFAENMKIRLAVENVRVPDHVETVLAKFHSSYVGLCYDSGHEHFYTPDIDWLDKYANRVFAIHLHDNNGNEDSHLLPFDGSINWNKKIRQIAASSYKGSITFECEMHSSKVYEKDGLDVFLKKAFKTAKKLEEMIR